MTKVRFEDKVAFITGGAIGFGRAFAEALADEGAAVVIADIDREAGSSAAAALEGRGRRALAVTCDVGDERQVQAAVAEAVDHFGGVDVLINNAGKHLMKYNQPFATLGIDELRSLFDVNVMAVVSCSLACQPSMAARGGGSILNIASIASDMSGTPYGVSKLAVRGLTIALARELSANNIRINCISPGIMATENAMSDLPEAILDEYVNRNQLIHRLGQMSDIVSAMLYLCSDESAFVTGETLRVSGGYPLHI